MGKFKKRWTDHDELVIDDIVPAHGNIDLGTVYQPFAKIYVDEIITSGVTEDYTKTVYAAGTAYDLTATQAAVDFGTTDPALTLDVAGTWKLTANATVSYAGATFAANQTVTLKLRRTNNTPADVANSSVAVVTGIVTTVTGTLATIAFPPVLYTTTRITDIIAMYGAVSVLPSAGSIQVSAASILAERLY